VAREATMRGFAPADYQLSLGLGSAERTVRAPPVVPPAGLDVPRTRTDGSQIRRFLEERAAEHAQGQSVVFELDTPLLAAHHLPAGFDETRNLLSQRLAVRATANTLSEDQLAVATLAVCAATAANPAARAGVIERLVGMDLGSMLRGQGSAAAAAPDDAARAAFGVLRTLAAAPGACAQTAAAMLRGDGGAQPDALQLRTFAHAADAIDPGRNLSCQQLLDRAREVNRALLQAPVHAQDGSPPAWPTDAQLRAAGVSAQALAQRVPALAIAGLRAELGHQDIAPTPAHRIAETLARSGLMTPHDIRTVEQGLRRLAAAASRAPATGFVTAVLNPRLPSVSALPPINAGDGFLTIQRGAQDSARRMADIGLALAGDPSMQQRPQTPEQQVQAFGRIAFLEQWGYAMPMDSQLRHRVVGIDEAQQIAVRAAELAGRQSDVEFTGRVEAWAQQQERSPERLRQEAALTRQDIAEARDRPGSSSTPALADKVSGLARRMEDALREAIPAAPAAPAADLSPMQALAAEIERFELATSLKLKTSHVLSSTDVVGAGVALYQAGAEGAPPVPVSTSMSASLAREAELEANLGAHGLELAFRQQNKGSIKTHVTGAGALPAGVGGSARLTQGGTRTWPAAEDSVLYVRLPRTSGDQGGVAGAEGGFKGDRLRAQTMAGLVRQMERMAANGEDDWVPKLAQACPQLSFTVTGGAAESDISRGEVDVTAQVTAGVPGHRLLGRLAGSLNVESRPDAVRDARHAGGAVDVERHTETLTHKLAGEAGLRLGPPGLRPAVGAKSNMAQGGTVTNTVLTRKDGVVAASDSYRTHRVQTLQAALALYDDHMDMYAKFSLEGDGRVQGNIDALAAALAHDPEIAATGVDEASLREHELQVEVAARANELRANIQDTPASGAKTYTSYELMKADVGDKLNAQLAVQALAEAHPDLAEAGARARALYDQLVRAPGSYMPVVVFEAQRETSTDTTSFSPTPVLDAAMAQQVSRSRPST
jgi:hypothetical protein